MLVLEISFDCVIMRMFVVRAGNSSPICVVSGARFLAKAGWVDMRNHSDTEPPLRLLRDNGRNYLQVRRYSWHVKHI